MEYQALYRQFRPELFSDVVGQDHIVRALSNQILTNKVAHAYLFCGTRGTGKTTTARLLSRAVNCESLNGFEPCNECESCKSILAGSAIDVIEIDAASNTSVDNIRQLKDDISYPPVALKYKVVIIDEVHMLSSGAFNALLKTLEEPPEYVIFILATTEYHKIPATILSRCQRFDFKRITTEEIIERLRLVAKETGNEIDDEACSLVAYAGDGSMRDSLSILDKCFSFSDKITKEDVTKILGIIDDNALFELSHCIASHNIERLLEIAENAINEGRDPILMTAYLIEHYRCLLVASYVKNAEGILQVSKERAEKFISSAKEYTGNQLIKIVKSLSGIYKMQKEAPNPKVILEIGLVSIADGYDKAPVRQAQPAVSPSVVPNPVKVVEPKVPAVSIPEFKEEDIPPETENIPSYQPVNSSTSSIADNWNEILDTIVKGSKIVGTSLKFSFPHEEGNTLTIVFKKVHSTSFSLVNKAENAKLVSNSIYEVTGKKINVKFKLEDGEGTETEIPKQDIMSKLEEKANKFPGIINVNRD